MNLYLDTEFTDLIPGAKLISIALVDENEDFFYAELTDTYKLEDCSKFVQNFVLPFLKGGEYRMTKAECELKIGNWIEQRLDRCIIVSDAPAWDVPHLNKLLEPLWPFNLEKICLPIYVNFNLQEKIVLENDYDIHNALDDAMVMKKADDTFKRSKNR